MSTQYKYIRYEVRAGVATVTLARANVHNALNDDFMAELQAAYRNAGEDSAVRSIVLAGEGKSFCAGADAHWMKRMVDFSVEENVRDANVLARMLRTMRDCPKPTIARVHGAAYGAGVGLTAACDMAVTKPGAIFCLSEVKLGILPAIISPFVMEKIGAHARRYALTAETFNGEEAHRIGLVSHVAADDAAMDAWIADVTAKIAGNGPQAISHCKRVMSDIQPFNWDTAQNLTTHRLAEVRVSPEGQEGLRAFLEKRAPAWVAARK
jgi:methylglutaconyl-CoA hydratase